MFENLLFSGYGKHRYSLASTGLKVKSEEFSSRNDAEHAMHLLMKKYGLHIENVYDDNHYKTYLCNNNVRFYINRI